MKKLIALAAMLVLAATLVTSCAKNIPQSTGPTPEEQARQNAQGGHNDLDRSIEQNRGK
ncbi:MAG: hypothetical protein WC889_11070 [Myxococcota bacterium]|jgi:hypothetical protein